MASTTVSVNPSHKLWATLGGFLLVVLLISIVVYMMNRSGAPGKWSDKQKQDVMPMITVTSCPSGKTDDLRRCVVEKVSAKYNYGSVKKFGQVSQDIHNITQACLPICDLPTPSVRQPSASFLNIS